jgi:extradiol dioxygenase family protein
MHDSATGALFHFSFNVTDLELARNFYINALGCKEGRSAPTWVDFDFFGHQLSLHLGEPFKTQLSGQVGDTKVPMPHFGIIVLTPQWQQLAERLHHHQIQFVIEPHLRFKGLPGEQWTMFFLDPFGNPIEVKGFDSFKTIY